jgi:hypothetical protein
LVPRTPLGCGFAIDFKKGWWPIDTEIDAALERLEAIDPNIEAFVDESNRRLRLEANPCGRTPGDRPANPARRAWIDLVERACIYIYIYRSGRCTTF